MWEVYGLQFLDFVKRKKNDKYKLKDEVKGPTSEKIWG